MCGKGSYHLTYIHFYIILLTRDWVESFRLKSLSRLAFGSFSFVRRLKRAWPLLLGFFYLKKWQIVCVMAFYFSVFLFWSGHNHTPKEKSKSAWVYPLQPIRFNCSSLRRVGEHRRWPIYSQPSSNRTFLQLRYRSILTMSGTGFLERLKWLQLGTFSWVISTGMIMTSYFVSKTDKMAELRTFHIQLTTFWFVTIVRCIARNSSTHPSLSTHVCMSIWCIVSSFDISQYQ